MFLRDPTYRSAKNLAASAPLLILAKIEILQKQLQALVEEFQDDEGEGVRQPGREPLDADLVDHVRILISDRPIFFSEINDATDAKKFKIDDEDKENKIKAVLTKMQRDEELVVNLGPANRALWYLFPPKVAARVLARLIELGVKSAGPQRA